MKVSLNVVTSEALRSLRPGDTFLHKGLVCIRSNSHESDSDSARIICVSLSCGSLFYIEPEKQVEPKAMHATAL